MSQVTTMGLPINVKPNDQNDEMSLVEEAWTAPLPVTRRAVTH